MIKRVLIFLGWSLSTFLMLVGFTGFIENPLMSIAVILWGLITFPPILKRTKKYGRTWNITGRIFTFILSLVIAGQAPQPVKTASEQVKAPQPTIAAKPKVIPSVEPSVVAPPTVSVSPSPDANIDSEDSKTTPSSELNSSQRGIAKQLYQELKELESEGSDMESLRVDNLAANEQCGRRMRELLPRAKSLEARAEVLPNRNPVRLYLGTASTSIRLCVTCSEELARESCKQVREDLKEVSDYLY